MKLFGRRGETDSTSDMSSYDAIPYQGFPRQHAHPEVLASAATLFGLQPPPVESSRILEIGCGDGANIISIAASLPGSGCAGVDGSGTQIQKGQEIIQGAGLQNIALIEGDFTHLAEPDQPYDYIIAHGVYSWVNPEAQNKLLALIKSQLSPNGIAFVSYNCYPGWHLRQMIRELMLFRTAGIDDPQERINISRQILPVLSQAVPREMRGYAALLQDEQSLLNQTADYYIAHEHLEEDNRPCYFHEFTDQLAANGLQFVTEAELSSMFINRYPAALGALMKEEDGIVEAQQYLDFALLRMFRQSIICHDSQTIERQLTSDVVRQMHASAFGLYAQQPNFDSQPESFQGAKGANITTSHPVSKAAMVVLAERWPARLTFEELERLAMEKLTGSSSALEPEAIKEGSQALAEILMAGATAELVELHTAPSRYTTSLSEQPIASELARYQAQSGNAVFNLRHQTVNLDAVNIRLIALLDGTNGHDALVATIRQMATDGELVLQENGQAVEGEEELQRVALAQTMNRLAGFARNALLVG